MSDAPISPLRRRMIEDMTVRNFSADTQRNYVRGSHGPHWPGARRRRGDGRCRRPPASGGSRPPAQASGLGFPSTSGPSRSSGLITARIVVVATRV